MQRFQVMHVRTNFKLVRLLLHGVLTLLDCQALETIRLLLWLLHVVTQCQDQSQPEQRETIIVYQLLISSQHQTPLC